MKPLGNEPKLGVMAPLLWGWSPSMGWQASLHSSDAIFANTPTQDNAASPEKPSGLSSLDPSYVPALFLKSYGRHLLDTEMDADVHKAHTLAGARPRASPSGQDIALQHSRSPDKWERPADGNKRRVLREISLPLLEAPRSASPGSDGHKRAQRARGRDPRATSTKRQALQQARVLDGSHNRRAPPESQSNCNGVRLIVQSDATIRISLI